MPSMPQDTVVAGCDRAVLGSGRPERGFKQGRSQPGVALLGLPRFMFTGTIVTPRADARPAGEMAIAGEPAHVDADLGNEDFCRPLIHPRNGIVGSGVI